MQACWKAIRFVVVLALFTGANNEVSYAQTAIDVKSVIFVLSKKWFQLTGDNKEGTFRSYAGVITEEKGLIDFPNIFMMHCPQGSQRYLTVHFPETYKFDGFGPSAWIPKSDFYVRI